MKILHYTFNPDRSQQVRFYFLSIPPICRLGLTLCLHPCAYESQRIAGELAAGTGDGSATQQHQNSRVS